MEVSGTQVSSLSSTASAASPNNTTAVSVLKKAMDIEKQSAMQLIESIPAAPSGNVGKNINITAKT